MRRTGLLGLAAIALIIGTADVIGAAQRSATAVVIPARYRIVQFAFDIDRLRDIVLISYQTHPRVQDTLLHVWGGSSWIEIGIDRYELGSFLKIRPERLILIGSDDDMPSDLLDASEWAADVERIKTLDLVTLANSLGTSFGFKRAEWNWIADRYDLKISDMNWKHRRYGRWGAPGQDPVRKPRRSWKFWQGSEKPSNPRVQADRLTPTRIEKLEPRGDSYVAPAAVETIVQPLAVEAVEAPVSDPVPDENEAPSTRVEFIEEITEPEPWTSIDAGDWEKGDGQGMPTSPKNDDEAADEAAEAADEGAEAADEGAEAADEGAEAADEAADEGADAADEGADAADEAADDTADGAGDAGVVSLDDLDPEAVFDPGDK